MFFAVVLDFSSLFLFRFLHKFFIPLEYFSLLCFLRLSRVFACADGDAHAVSRTSAQCRDITPHLLLFAIRFDWPDIYLVRFGVVVAKKTNILET